MEYASFSERVFSLIIDCIILTLLEQVLPVNILYHDILPLSYESEFFEVLVNFEFLVLSPLYFVGMRLWNNGQTFGKKIFKIKTVRTDGKKLNFFESVVDCLGYYILPLDIIVGAFISARGQRLTQACAGTVVINEDL